MYRLTAIWVNLLLSLRSMLFLHSVSRINPLKHLCDVPVFPFLVSLMQRSLFRQWISFHWQSHLFDLIFFFSPSPFFGHDCKPGGIQFVVAVWMETRPPIFFIRLAFVGYSVTARIMYSGGSRWCTNLDNRSSRSSIWGTFERFLSISFVLQI